MQVRPWHVAGLAGIALPALWLLLAGPDRVLGLDGGKLGMAALVTAAWSSLFALSQLPRGAAESRIAPGEWKAWIGTGFMLLATGYFAASLDTFAGASPGDGAAQAVGRNLVMLLIAWVVLSQVMSSRWKGAVKEDERDRAIEQRAGDWGRAALIVLVVALAVLLTFSPPERLAWASHLMIANLLVMGLMGGWLCECIACAWLYWRDRQ